MKAPAKLAAYAVVLAIVTGGGAVVGAAAGPIDVGGDTGDEAGHDMGSGSEAEGNGSEGNGPEGGEPGAEGTDAHGPATGDEPAAALPAPSDHAQVDGYEVTLDGDATPGESQLGFTVSLAGEPVRTDPYLGADGHLVVIRAGDLAYLHVHPLDSEGDEVRFAAEFPSPGTYRLFLDFAHGGEVRTAAFTVEVPDAYDRSAPSTTAHDAPAPADGAGDDDDDEGH